MGESETSFSRAKNCQPGILYPIKLSFWNEIKEISRLAIGCSPNGKEIKRESSNTRKKGYQKEQKYGYIQWTYKSHLVI